MRSNGSFKMRRRIVTAICLSIVLATLLVGSGRVSRRADVPKGAARGSQSGCFAISRGNHERFEAADFADSNNGWAISISDVWRTSDGGREWTRVTPPPTRAGYALAFAHIQALSREEAWVLEDVSLLHTTDSGNSWQVGCRLKDVS